MAASHCLIVSALALGSVAASGQDDLRGADALIHEISDAAGAPPAEEATSEQQSRFTQAAKRFQAAREGLSDEDVASGWLELVELYADAPERDIYAVRDGEYRGFDLLIASLPAPRAWDELRDLIFQQPVDQDETTVRVRALRMLAHQMQGDFDAFWTEVAELEKFVVANAGWSAQQLAKDISLLEGNLSYTRIGQPGMEIDAFERLVRRIANAAADDVSSYEFFGVEIPDLLSLTTREKAESLLQDAVSLPVMLHIVDHEETAELARDIALRRIDDLRVPQWKLARSPDAAKLYEALEESFVKSQAAAAQNDPGAALARMRNARGLDEREFETQHHAARWHYLHALVADGRLERAREVLDEFTEPEGPFYYHMEGSHMTDYSALGAMRRSEHAEDIWHLLESYLDDHPRSAVWPLYIALSSQTNHTAKMVARIEREIPDMTFEWQDSWSLDHEWKKALLAADEVELAAAMLRKQMNADPDEQRDRRVSAAKQLAEIGAAIGNDALGDEGIDRALDLLADDIVLKRNRTDLTALLIDAGRLSDAERLLTEDLRDSVVRGDDGYPYGDGIVSHLGNLARVYHAAGRSADVVKLLDRGPWWGMGDLIALDENLTSFGWYREDDPILLVAARALHETGNDAAARRIAEYILLQNMAFDPAYELLVRIDGIRTIPLFKRLAERNRFEERPLIWIAEALLGADRIEAAEASVRRAIAIDPSDGESGPDLRMQAYATLAKIERKKGNDKDADFLENVVRAIRVAEDADALFQTGLTRRALARYNESIEFFADAYCVRARLAVQLADEGRVVEAAEHYRKAYELMPSSFGRMETHCFGCESIFEGSHGQTIAEEIFERMVADDPENPRLHYLLGYLRDRQGRKREAFASFQSAVELDPDYYNAWSFVSWLAEFADDPIQRHDEAVLNLLRLDPFEEINQYNASTFADLRNAWQAAAFVDPNRVEPPESVYPLAASAQRMAELEKAAREAGRSFRDPYRGVVMVPHRPTITPHDFLVRNRVVDSLGDLLRFRLN